ncbi:hypothetical protein Kpol_303p2 [Vanderwaltozyma polyspora DSM 70294]|uniref:Anaphase spindle elongation protein n=1 Tax=Vanderwaltozyma polyspora (strain ATCC 22028 / DSM 70294 / BCRC 21397 / CBS 2163 / NBRC 10782 / NRRL Y-8283 / UCD 57-17) TaxID=436907 RepID=A7TSZ9_VANPO|nr:uncharacterized protein Kpol_303p2 [Vanderwaltozyma polyspora DSM 70294]EDO14603.1 hypothetical protein Kpol_303p2 [Vanderwaltozyma polyspora DSM 70294]
MRSIRYSSNRKKIYSRDNYTDLGNSNNASMTVVVSTPTIKGEDTLYANSDCLRLTPVNLNCLTSPIRSTSKNNDETVTSNTIYTENFNLISRQLEKLLEDLNVIYNRIGYSNSEILNKERLIFSTLSDSITEYFEQADKDMNELITGNHIEQEMLNKILDIINDSNGTQTIPDLYIRNSILIQQSKTVPLSPKKEASLLSKRKVLKSARRYIFNSYIPKLLKFLQKAIVLQKLMSSINDNREKDFIPQGAYDIISNIPSLDLMKNLLEKINESKDNFEMISTLIQDNNKLLLDDECFHDISKKMLDNISETTEIFEKEYDNRLTLICSIAKKISKLITDLKIDENTLDLETANNIRIYAEYKLTNTEDRILVRTSIIKKLEKILQNYELIYNERQEQRNELLLKCQSLWIKLKVPDHQINEFIENNQGLSVQVINSYQNELSRLESMKKKLIKTLIVDSWTKIEELWSTLQYTDEEKSSFVTKFANLKQNATTLKDDEELLDVCENESKILEKKLAVYKPVLELYEEFKSLQDDNIALEKSSKDSSRLLSRNSHKILLQEEKTRKRITRHFPRVIEELKIKLDEMEELFGKPFMVQGKKLYTIVLQQEEELISKYPRIRLNTSTRKKPSPSRKSSRDLAENKQPISLKVEKRKSPSIQGSNINTTISAEYGMVHKTPIRAELSSTIDTSTILSKLDDSHNYNRYMKTTRLISPPKQMTRLLQPTIISKKEPSNILEDNENEDNIDTYTSSKKPLKARNGYIHPTRLFPISISKLNQKGSQIPVLIKNLNENPNVSEREGEKENVQHNLLDTNEKQHFIRGGALIKSNYSSPYREPDNSIYKISMSPDGKCQLNVQDGVDSGVDDTSIMDEDNDKIFMTWKREQLSKLNGITNSNILPEEHINWSTDVL